MNALAPKLVLTPLLVASTSIVGRRWGNVLSGWLVALPLTSGPIAFFIAIDLGPQVAIAASAGSLVGAIGQVAFCAAYTMASRRVGWHGALMLGSISFAMVGLVLPPLPPGLVFGLVLIAVAGHLRLTRSPDRTRSMPAPPGWDIPARVAIATLLVVIISGAAPMLGGRASGVLATFPVYAAVLATFAHGRGDAAAAADVLRGLTIGMIGFATFFLCLGIALATLAIGLAFGLSLAMALLVQVITLPLIRRRRERTELG